MKPAISEAALAEQVCAYLTDLGWDLFFEVQFYTGGNRADIVGRRGPLIYVVEAKTSFGLAVLAQAHEWLSYANLVSVAVPVSRRMSFGQQVCADYGIGVLARRGDFSGNCSIVERIPPRLRRRVSPRLADAIDPAHKEYAKPGTQGGGHYTPFNRTVREVKNRLRGAPDGLSMREIITGLDHHYSSDSTARSALSKWIQNGYVPGIRVDVSTRPARFFLDEQGATA